MRWMPDSVVYKPTQWDLYRFNGHHKYWQYAISSQREGLQGIIQEKVEEDIHQDSTKHTRRHVFF